MKIRYDRKANAASLYLADRPLPGGVAKSYQCDFDAVGGIINLDFDAEGKLISIELINATSLLPQHVLDEAELIE